MGGSSTELPPSGSESGKTKTLRHAALRRPLLFKGAREYGRTRRRHKNTGDHACLEFGNNTDNLVLILTRCEAPSRSIYKHHAACILRDASLPLAHQDEAEPLSLD
jgi:hypothetical protein